ncbi:tRNA (adenine(37)-N6)-methyltransferase [Anopheles marshallii]|uniref:tRNA (adenine(37)-N6)-methyltransferase n=1 Tax=Anopheles marshallii TaxID=1521116 RepID=UPI00237AFE0F|nr:tRNA (adenine(37)-N6)-methyltransferase [Anopheles marshallii]
MSNSEIEYLKAQLATARSEIKNLRQQLSNLQHMHTKEHQHILKLLTDYRCEGCQEKQQQNGHSNKKQDVSVDDDGADGCTFKPIGVIKTVFNEKRAVPRQASLASGLLSRIDISSTTFNNPAHSLEGLENFSHLWIIYYFHRNPNHAKAKVAPPRLGGERVGVFSTRSPHRPCPIGLSLVELDRIEDFKVYFLGTDMVDGTPVLDIKPYIPQYDVPVKMKEAEFLNSREAPDGEETNLPDKKPGGSNHTQTGPAVTVPNWVLNSSSLNVMFNANAESQLQELQIEKNSIVDVLKADPRSVYLRTKYGSQIYTFRLGEHTVTCKFDDQNTTVTVLQIRDVVNFQEMDGECSSSAQ